ncbi:MAG: hypothetical protein PVH61_18245 [Candidatus Aminicenantes bacterium]
MWQKMSKWLHQKQWRMCLYVNLETRKKSKGKEKHTKFSLALKVTLVALSVVAVIVIQVSC